MFLPFVYDEILVKSDGPLAEVMGQYSILMVLRKPGFVLGHFERNGKILIMHSIAIRKEIGVYRIRDGDEPRSVQE